MAYWTTPVTDREAGARMTYVDMNRITNNLNYLAETMHEHQMYQGRYLDKVSWTWNDYVELIQWTKILGVLADVTRALGMEGSEEANYDTTYTNINIVETFTQQAYQRFNQLMSQGALGKYVDTEVYAGDNYYLGGVQDPWTSPYRRIRHYVDTELYCGEVANVGGYE